MIQPLVKLKFVEHYCCPEDGWQVFVDIDPSEEGRTGSPRKTEEAKARQRLMLEKAPDASRQLRQLRAFVGRRGYHWKRQFKDELFPPPGDRDIIAVHLDHRILWVAEVEGDSSGQPEGKIYKALGQLVCAVSEIHIPDFEHFFSLVVWGDGLAKQLKRVRAVEHLGMSGLVIGECREDDQLLFGKIKGSNRTNHSGIKRHFPYL